MATTANLRSRRSAAQLHALAGVEREIRAQDPSNRRKYLREFSEAFRTYDALLDPRQVRDALSLADVILVGDYHALATCQRYAASVIEQLALMGRQVVLGVETIFARDQHILDEWWRREIDESELRERIRFDLDWGYDWTPFHELLVAARDHADALYGLDCMPREDLRKIGARDRHAAAKLAEIRDRHPNAAIVVLFGESHLAPGHLPLALREELPAARPLTILQNVDALYWRAAGERRDRVEAVRVSDDVLCVFNATPLEKYESYRLFLDRWGHFDGNPDFAPTFYNLINSLAAFLEINRYSPHNGTQPRYLVDLLPEVYGHSSDATFHRLLSRQNPAQEERESILQFVEERGSAYLPQINAFYVREFQMASAAEDATRFLHQACQGLPQRVNGHLSNGSAIQSKALDRFYVRIIEHAVACFGSNVLCPSGLRNHADAEFMLSRAACEKAAQSAVRGDWNKFDSSAREWGFRIGSQIYEAYLAGRVKKSGLRRLFLAHLNEPGLARKVCVAVMAKLRSAAKFS
ncbi:MAG TPA: ChaN family lipoprotein [Candidatus Sulfotelmatobacter sp.]